MGAVVYAASPAARRVFDEADETLGYALSRLCFEGPAEELRQTHRQQPAILACSLALLAAHDEREGPFQAAVVTGHSLGLYTALVAAGALPLGEALRLVALRGELMQRAAEARQGGMAAVLGLDDAVVEDACAAASQGVDLVVAANFNAPGQVVISGAAAALERAIACLKERGARKVVPLPVAGAFHSPLMAAAAEALAPSLHATRIADPRCPVVSNGAARLLHTGAEIRAELLGQILAPVRWVAAVRAVAAHGVGTIVDCGPSTTLAGLLKRILAGGDQPPHALTVVTLDT